MDIIAGRRVVPDDCKKPTIERFEKPQVDLYQSITVVKTRYQSMRSVLDNQFDSLHIVSNLLALVFLASLVA